MNAVRFTVTRRRMSSVAMLSGLTMALMTLTFAHADDPGGDPDGPPVRLRDLASSA